MNDDEILHYLALAGVDLGWIAGVIDGEGSLHYTYHMKKGVRVGMPTISVGQVDISMILKLQRLLGGVFGGPYKKPNPNHSPNFVWKLRGKKAVDLCRLIVPFLTTKRIQALEMIDGKVPVNPRTAWNRHHNLPGRSDTCTS